MKKVIFILSVFLGLTATAQDKEKAVASIQSSFQKEIKKLSRRTATKNAFALIEAQREQTLKDHILLTEIPAPPFKEEVRAAQFAKMLEAAGADSVWIDKMGNVIALRKGKSGKKVVALDAHLDTVFPEGTNVRVQMRGDTLYAPGISDDTRGLAMVIRILSVMNEAAVKTDADILFIGTVGEEGLGDLRGVKFLFSQQGVKIDSWIAIDGGAIGRVNNQGLGSHRYKVTFKGPGGHSWGAFGLANPHHAQGSAIHYFVKAADKFTAYGPKTSYNVGVMEGGTSINSVPFESSMLVDMRSVSPERLDSMDVILKTAVRQALAAQNQVRRLGAELTVDIKKIGDRPSGELPETLPLVQRAMACTAFFGKRPRLTRGSTNSNTPISMNIPAVTIGRGGEGRNAHSLDEWWLDKDGYKATQLALMLLLAESGLAK